MANYTSHMVMCNNLYDNLYNNDSFKIHIDKDTMVLFSLGQDFNFSSRSCFLDAHYYNSRNFFIETIKYIKKNNLQYKKDAMAYLYGHIAHYALDIKIHPFVGKVIKDVKSKSIITPHTVLECEIDKYLLEKFNNNIKFNNLPTSTLNNKDIKNMINVTYRNVYGLIDAYYVYKNTSLIIKMSNNITNYACIKNKNILDFITRKKFYDNNSLFYSYVNNNNLLNKEIDKILIDSLKLAENIILYVNKYLYFKSKEKYLNIFDDTPYDIGVIKEINYDYNGLKVYSNVSLEIK